MSLIWLNAVFGQVLNFQHITTNDGLSQNSVVSIAQDSFGFIYYATQDGLNKFDGTNFTVYEEYFRDITNEKINELGKIYIDSKNRIWIVTDDGHLKKYNKESDTFTSIAGLDRVSCITELDEDLFLVGSHTLGLFKLELHADTTSTTKLLPNLGINQIVVDKERVVLVTRKGVLTYSDQNVSVLWPSLKDINISKVIFRENQIIIGTYGHGVYVSHDFISLHHMSQIPESLNVQDLLIDHQNRLWIATYGEGVFLRTEEGVKQFTADPRNNLSINYNDILVLFEDKLNNIWFGTDGGGVSYLESNAKPIFSITKHQLPIGYPVDVPRAISTDQNGNIWIGTSGNGLTVVNNSLDKLNHFSTMSSGRNKLPSDRIMSLFHDSKGDLWIGSQGDGLIQFSDQKINSITSLPCETVWDIEEADETHLWLCTRNQGLILLNTLTQKWTQFIKDNSSILSNNIRVITKGERPNEFYIGTENGHVMSVDLELGEFHDIPLPITTGTIKSLSLKNQKLWIGTQQKGIVIYHTESGKFDLVDKTRGLKNNVIYAILPQGNNYVWVSSNTGISQLVIDKIWDDSVNVVNQHLTQQNGLVSNEFNTGAYHMDEAGVMYFGGIDGINYFNPNYILKDIKTIDVTILDLITTDHDGKHIIKLFDQSSVELDHKQQNFQIRYVAQDFSKHNNTNYKYKLEGIHEEWISNERNELVSFSNLPVGDYRFLVKASNKDGVWNSEPNRIEISIVPAFWQRTWFQLLIAFLCISSLILLYRYRIDQIKRTSLLKQRALKAESRALKSQMNPHFIFNSLNSIDSFIINNEPEIASDYLTKFSKLMRSILEYSNHDTISLDDELKSLQVYLKMEQMRFKNKFKFHIDVDESIDKQKTMIPTMVIQPFVENAIWHGLIQKNECGSIEIKASHRNSKLQIDIIDDGIGRQKASAIKSKTATKRKSYGMRITKERMKLLEQLEGKGGSIEVIDLIDENKNPLGTQVSILFKSSSLN